MENSIYFNNISQLADHTFVDLIHIHDHRQGAAEFGQCLAEALPGFTETLVPVGFF